MSSKHPPTLSGPPETEGDHEVIPFDHQEHGHSTLPGTPPTCPSVSELDGKYDRLTRELVLVSAVFIVLIALALAALFGVFTASQEVQQPTTNWSRVTQAHLHEDRLTQPPGANALEAYLKAQQLDPGSSAADRGLHAISARYLEMIHNLIENGDIKLASETLNAAALVIPHAPKDYVDALVEAREQLQLAQRKAQEREPARSTAETYEPLKVFQDYFKDGTLGPQMVVIPDGNLVIGSPEQEPEREEDEGPLLPASIRSFAMAQTETTFAEYSVFTQAVGWALPDDFGWGRGQRPVINVSWLEARAYATWLSKQTGFRYRLPTEAEWEYAARAGTTTTFITGDCLTPDYANVDFRSKSQRCPGIPVTLGKTVPVGDRQPNPWGLHNVYGNVREWVQDCATQSYNPLIADGRAHFSSEGGNCGASVKRSIRGGAWHARTSSARTANRYAMPEHEWANNVGFRLVRELD